jgi:hypothetical protein
MTDTEKIIKAHCNTCLGERNHSVLHEEEQLWDEEYEPGIFIYGGDRFRMIKCCGCDSVKLQHSDWFSESCDEHGRPYVNVKYYPPATSKPEPTWLKELKSPFASDEQQYIVGLLHEIYTALHNDSRRLAVMGARALLEHIMISKVGDNGSFIKNLKAFETQGYLSVNQREIIEPILEAGHASIHRGFHPSVEDVQTVIQITESLVETTYVHSKKASKLKDRVPNRKSKKAT